MSWWVGAFLLGFLGGATVGTYVVVYKTRTEPEE